MATQIKADTGEFNFYDALVPLPDTALADMAEAHSMFGTSAWIRTNPIEKRDKVKPILQGVDLPDSLRRNSPVECAQTLTRVAGNVLAVRTHGLAKDASVVVRNDRGLTGVISCIDVHGRIRLIGTKGSFDPKLVFLQEAS